MKLGGECTLLASSRDQADLTAQFGQDPNVSGKFPISSAASRRSHALHSQSGLSLMLGLCLPSIPPASDLPGPLARPCHRRASPWHGEPRASSRMLCLSFPLGKVSLWQGICKPTQAEQAAMRVGMGHAWPVGTQCAACLSTLLSRPARLYKYPAFWKHCTQQPSRAPADPVVTSIALPGRAPRWASLLTPAP